MPESFRIVREPGGLADHLRPQWPESLRSPGEIAEQTRGNLFASEDGIVDLDDA